MFIHYIFEWGKEKGLEESDPEPHGKHSVEHSKEIRQCTNVCILKKKTQWFWDQAALISGKPLTKPALADTEKTI